MSRERVIGPFTFPTRKAAEEAIRKILHGVPLDDPLQGDHRVLIEALLRCHHEAEEKVGPGVAEIVVKRIEYGARGFWVTRTDGTGIDFSYRTALDGAKSHRSNVLTALRFAVDRQIRDFRLAWFKEHAGLDGTVTCQLSGLQVPFGPLAHVDHVIPFADLAAEFITSCGGVGKMPYRQSAEHVGPELSDPEQALTWEQYHQDNAKLRVIHASANLARHRSGSAA